MTAIGTYQGGERIRLIQTGDPFTNLHWGDLGTVDEDRPTDDEGTVFIRWDNGEQLGLIPDVDQWEVIEGGMIDAASPG